MKFSTSKLLPLVMQLGSYLKSGIDQYAALKTLGEDVDPDIIKFFIEEKMTSWDPKINNKALLDETTRSAGARFLAGIACNVAQ